MRLTNSLNNSDVIITKGVVSCGATFKCGCSKKHDIIFLYYNAADCEGLKGDAEAVGAPTEPHTDGTAPLTTTGSTRDVQAPDAWQPAVDELLKCVESQTLSVSPHISLPITNTFRGAVEALKIVAHTHLRPHTDRAHRLQHVDA